MTTAALAPRTALFLPASNARAIEKARGLGVDMVILDLEDAVKPQDKAMARDAAVEAVTTSFGESLRAIRINVRGAPEHGHDLVAVQHSVCDYVVAPKIDTAEDARAVASVTGKPLLAMIETPLGVLNAVQIAAVPGVAGLIAGVNDLRASLGIPDGAPRASLALALQTIVLAARAAGIWAFDGVYNRLEDSEGLAADCHEGRMTGFDGKSLIHPNQIEIATRAFAPTDREIAEARALIAAASGGAERYGDRMIEAMHVDQAKALLARAG
ncbi:MAG: CoA ester lyase [Sphingomonadales bacterium]|nr:MAG: CoA ester lyase [Sphingomonadales bacterium]